MVWWYCGLVVLYHGSSQMSRVFLKVGASFFARSVTRLTNRTAVYGPVRTVVWEGRRLAAPPYPDCLALGSRGIGIRHGWVRVRQPSCQQRMAQARANRLKPTKVRRASAASAPWNWPVMTSATFPPPKSCTDSCWVGHLKPFGNLSKCVMLSIQVGVTRLGQGNGDCALNFASICGIIVAQSDSSTVAASSQLWFAEEDGMKG